MEETKQELQRHLEAAYRLVPAIIKSGYPSAPDDTGLKNLKLRYERQDWYQLFAFLQVYSDLNHFSDELLFHLKAAEQLYDLYDRLGMRAALEQLTEEEKHIIGQCLNAAMHGPFFLDDWEFPLVFGATHQEAVQIAAAWPHIEETDMMARTVINNTINNLFGYPHGKEDQWSKYISVSPQQVNGVYHRFRVLTGLANNNEKPYDSQSFQNFR